MTFYQKYVALCTERGEKPSPAAQKMGISKTTVNRWKKGGGATDASLQTIANYFNVSVEYLKEDEADEQKKPTAQGDELTKEDVEKWIKTEATDEELIQFIAAASAKLVKK